MKGKKALILVTAIFILPVVAAKLVLEFDWYSRGVTNKGELLAEAVNTDWLEENGQWRLVYTLPSDCDALCETALFQLTQIPVAVGREQERVSSIVLVSDTPSDNRNIEVRQQSMDAQQQKTMAALPYGNDAIYIVDPLNNLILAYPIPEGKDAQITQSKGLLSDLRKLMKMSKVG
ncbi:hypothetical protein [Enterovibrio norvegicus]|uniref:Cytochrome oxidase n=1 Tax=Enterovibrio norvegicus TaxID=188144 RepID=A0A2N7LEE4_9GAMM|nr:hypothetical protein [Enterovibrio norvegicus]PMN93775.1 hypothetical protein BCT23_12115 [Enterovibrio norvegicus]